MAIMGVTGDPTNADSDRFVDLTEVKDPAAVLQESHQWYKDYTVLAVLVVSWTSRRCYFSQLLAFPPLGGKAYTNGSINSLGQEGPTSLILRK